MERDTAGILNHFSFMKGKDSEGKNSSDSGRRHTEKDGQLLGVKTTSRRDQILIGDVRN